MLALASASAPFAALALGWLVDGCAGKRRVFRLVEAAGLLALALSAAFIGPFAFPASWAGAEEALEQWDAKLRPSVILAGVALALNGIGGASATVGWSSAALAYPAAPPERLGDGDELASAMVSRAWSSAAALGAVGGPLLGGALCETMGFGAFAGFVALAALAAAALLALAALLAPEGDGGFDGDSEHAQQRAQTALHAMRKRAQTARSATVFSSLDVSEALHFGAAAMRARGRRSASIRGSSGRGWSGGWS
jgi:hypothetical protein